MQKSWSERLQDAKQEREAVEDTTMGCYVEFFMRKFFISEEVIPECCKVYVKGKVKSYNFNGVDLNDLVVKEVFRRRVKFKTLLESQVDMTNIAFRMEGLWLILEHNEAEYKGLIRDIYSYALLGAVASLFSTLSEHPAFEDILTAHLQKALRKKAFHFHFSFRYRVNNAIDLKTLKIIAAHIYEHCRLELADYSNFSPLSFSIFEEQRYTLEFKSILSECLDTHSVYYEFNKTLIDNLSKDSLQLTKIIDHLNDDNQIFCSSDHGYRSRQAIAGNAIGLLVANVSASVMSLTKERTYSNAKLNKDQKAEIQKQYGCYVQKGAAFRHNKVTYMGIIVYFNISMGKPAIPKNLPKAIEASKNKLSRPKINKQPIRYDRTTRQYSQYLWGIMNDGELTGLSQNLSCHILNSSNGEVKNDLMLNSATPQFPYFEHAMGRIPVLVLKSRYMVIVAFQYLHLIDMDPLRCEPEKIMLLPEGGGMAIVELEDNSFAVGSGSGQVTIHDSETGQVLNIFPANNKSGQCVRCVSEFAKLPNNRLACGYNDGEVVIWNIKTSQCEAILLPSDELAMDIVPHPTIDNVSLLYPKKKIPGVWKGGKPQGSAFSLMVSKDGNLFVGYGDQSIALWDMRTYKLIKTFVGHEGWPQALMVLPNGQLVSTGADKTLRVWNKNGCKKTLKLSHAGFFAKIVGNKVIVADHHHSTEISLPELTDSLPGNR